jgi:hypothetical protein
MATGKKDAAAAMLEEPTTEAAAAADSSGGAGQPFIGQWNRLVSTTNWEKGRIICQWRETLIAAEAPVTDYSDEAWSQLVGGVTSQHVGRLRRVFDRFGQVFDQYEGLYWSHFQAAIDWPDAEMWLEGAIHNGWSVSQMRGKRWETLGKPGEAPAEEDAALAEEMEGAATTTDGELVEQRDDAAFAPTPANESIASPQKKRASSEEVEDDAADETASDGEASEAEPAQRPAKSRSRLAVEVDELPDDLAEAFEQFKLAIIAQRRLGWSETTPTAVIECLDALRELTLAPLDD